MNTPIEIERLFDRACWRPWLERSGVLPHDYTSLRSALFSAWLNGASNADGARAVILRALEAGLGGAAVAASSKPSSPSGVGEAGRPRPRSLSWADRDDRDDFEHDDLASESDELERRVESGEIG